MPQSVIVVSYDGVGCGNLGPYGSTWAATPALNELAARGEVFDFVLANSPNLETVLRGWWTGRHPAQPSHTDLALLTECQTAGIHTALISDDREVCRAVAADQFSERQLLEASRPRVATALEECALCRGAAAAVDAVAGLKSPFLAWVHLGSLSRLWDVPMELRYQLADESDPEVPDFIEPPNGLCDDVDVLWANQLVYAAQMLAVDASVGMFVDFVDQLRAECEVALCVTAPRSFALGSHRQSGLGLGLAYSEEMHVPLLLDAAQSATAGSRNSALMDSTHLYHLLRTQLGLAAEESAAAIVDRVVYTSETHRALRTPAWFLREEIGSPESAQLFVKPDDRWDANEVADRCPEIVDEMRGLLEEFLAAAAQEQLDQLAPVAQHLRV